MSGLISPWVPETDPRRLKVLGKFNEEMTEAATASARCIIQGIGESEPVTGKPNKEWLEDEVADAMAVTALAMEELNLDVSRVMQRSKKKYEGFKKWLEMMPLGEFE